jgi:hypothetical protein
VSIPARARRALIAVPIAVTVAGACASSPGSPTPANRAPYLVLSYVTTSSCTPGTGVFRFCELDLVASASDPDGDSVGAFSWSSKPTVPGSGTCYSFDWRTPARVRCQLSSPEQTITATVTVADSRGLSASASLTVFGEGVNRPPEIILAPSLHLSAITPTMSLYAGVIDPDEGRCCGGWQFRSVSVTGDCLPTPYVDMACLSGDRVDLYRTAPAGVCHLTLEAQDSAGATTSRTVALSYPPR